QEGRMVLPGLERRIDVHEQRRVVEPVRIPAAAVYELPRAWDDRLLVGVEQVPERQPVLEPDDAQRRGTGEDRDESGPGAAPAARIRLRVRRRRRDRRRFALRR